MDATLIKIQFDDEIGYYLACADEAYGLIRTGELAGTLSANVDTTWETREALAAELTEYGLVVTGNVVGDPSTVALTVLDYDTTDVLGVVTDSALTRP